LSTGLLPSLGRAALLSHKDYLENTPTEEDAKGKYQNALHLRNLIGHGADSLKSGFDSIWNPLWNE